MKIKEKFKSGKTSIIFPYNKQMETIVKVKKRKRDSFSKREGTYIVKTAVLVTKILKCEIQKLAVGKVNQKEKKKKSQLLISFTQKY